MTIGIQAIARRHLIVVNCRACAEHRASAGTLLDWQQPETLPVIGTKQSPRFIYFELTHLLMSRQSRATRPVRLLRDYLETPSLDDRHETSCLKNFLMVPIISYNSRVMATSRDFLFILNFSIPGDYK